ncbi:MAG: transporter substrate-binding domain-containing protein [Planctomycetota bacterium]|jgi:polar amino acid transport system substrate-binding protein|nr:transporter substrate-binding domain-containing protein [Planctomycetota bacterium]
MEKSGSNARGLARAILLGAALALLAAGRTPAGDAKLAAIEAAKTVRIAVPQGSPPFGFTDSDMELIGYDIDMADLIAKGLGVKLESVPVTSTNRVPYLSSGRADLIISSLGKNPEREKVIDFTQAYAPFYSGVFGPADIAVKGPGDLDGKTVSVTRGSVEDLELTKIISGLVDMRRFEDGSAVVAAYLSGQVQLIAVGNVVAGSLNARNPAKPLEPKFMIKNSPCYIGLPRDEPALKAKLNAIIADLKKTGKIAELCEKWLNIPMPADL